MDNFKNFYLKEYEEKNFTFKSVPILKKTHGGEVFPVKEALGILNIKEKNGRYFVDKKLMETEV